MRKRNLEKLYFGVKRYHLDKFETANAFGSVRVLTSIATWVLMKPEIRRHYLSQPEADPLYFCFGDLSRRVEWEMGVLPVLKGDAQKTDVYELYIEPNRDHLLSLVDSVSKTSARRVLAKYRRT